jgi:hypothetical protein
MCPVKSEYRYHQARRLVVVYDISPNSYSDMHNSSIDYFLIELQIVNLDNIGCYAVLPPIFVLDSMHMQALALPLFDCVENKLGRQLPRQFFLTYARRHAVWWSSANIKHSTLERHSQATVCSPIHSPLSLMTTTNNFCICV